MQGPLGIAHTLAQVKLGSEVALSRSAGHNALTGRTRIAGSLTVSKSKVVGEWIRLDWKTTSACIAVQACLLLPTYGEDMITGKLDVKFNLLIPFPPVVLSFLMNRSQVESLAQLANWIPLRL